MSTILMSQARNKRRRVDPGTVHVGGEQASGGRIADVGYVKLSGKRYDPYKMLRANIKHFTCSLGLRRDAQTPVQDAIVKYPPGNAALYSKFMCSEYNPGRAGCVPVVYDTYPGTTTQMGTGLLPMHLFDLSTCPMVHNQSHQKAVEDARVTFPERATTQCEDINSRFWIWSCDHRDKDFNMRNGRWRVIPKQFTEGTVATKEVTCAPRWTWDENDYVLTSNQKVYKRSIDVRMNLYGCSRLQTKFDVRVIRFLDPEMAPDHADDLPGGIGAADNTYPPDKLTLFRDRWYSMVKPFVSNPILKGLDRQDYPALNKKWFQTVYKKKVEIAEVAGAGVDGGPPVASLSFSIPINEIQDFAWDSRYIKPKATTGAAYDETTGANQTVDQFTVGSTTVTEVPAIGNARYMYQPPSSSVDGQGNIVQNMHTKPHPKSRLYLLIRALAPMDQRSTGGSGTDPGNMDIDGGNATGGVNWNTASTEGGFFHLDGLRPPFSRSAAKWNDTGDWDTAAIVTNSLSYDYTPSYDIVVRQHFTGMAPAGDVNRTFVTADLPV